MNSTAIAPATLICDPAYARLKSHVVETTGLAYYLNQDQALAGHVADRLAALGLSQLGEYLDLLSDAGAGQAEWDALIAELTIGETYFFRHREQFDALRDHLLPELIERNRQQRRLRIWSAGCATGEEPYSLSILLKRDLAHLVSGWDVTILGSDINRDYLDRARRGEFADWVFRAASEEEKQSCFVSSGDRWAIKPEFKSGVSFQCHNLVQQPFPSPRNGAAAFDLILCRNVLIYFPRDIVRRMIGQFHDCLSEGGWLLVGHAEPDVGLFRSFHTKNVPGAVLYQKRYTGAVPGGHPPDPTRKHKWSGPAGGAAPMVSTAYPPARPDRIQSSQGSMGLLPPQRATNAPVAADLAARLAEIRVSADRGNWPEAARRCDELIADQRLDPRAHLYHALILEQMGRHVEAVQALRRTIYLDRRSVLAHYHLGLLLRQRRDAPGAKRAFRNTLKLLHAMDEAQTFADANGLTVAALRQWTQTHLEALCHP